MSRRSPRLDLKLNLSPPMARGDSSRGRMAIDGDGDDSSPTGSSSSSPSSCVSSEEGGGGGLRWSNSPEATSMVLAGCPRCLMYVMLSEDDPKCPKCKSPVLLDFRHGGGGGGTFENNKSAPKKNRRT
ncbi:hypothetical protein ACMD2_03963 [Ananas comosus]|uniref:GIR1-like zinc ribbon domain-containing protein n=1 Tax=Ananas comosus TaxID=4615 RepID=A0A199UGJ4_ANACO|nr:hypothetical protein ACMD2_03963 [Ananas comosus]